MIRREARSLILGLACLAGTAVAPAQAPGPRFTWETHLYGSWMRAVKEDRPLLVYFHMAGCRHCDQLDREVFATPQFTSLASRAIVVRVDEARDDEHKNVAKMLRSLEIDRFPITVILDAKKEQIEEVTRLVGYHPADKFLKGVADGLAKWEKPRKEGKPVLSETADAKKFTDSAVMRASISSDSSACSLADAAVAKALRDMGYKFRTEDLQSGKGCNHILSVEQEGRSTPVYVAHLYGRTVWLGVPLARLEESRATAPALLRLLEENWTVFPAQFNYDRATRQLFLSKALDQQEVLTPEQFRTQVQHLLHLVKQKESLWTGLAGR